jgi:hypothetical protein
MSANTLKTPRADQPAAAPTSPSPLAPSDGANTNTVRMTMAEWKRIHRDYKGSHIGPDGRRWRSVLRPGGMVTVEIVK